MQHRKKKRKHRHPKFITKGCKKYLRQSDGSYVNQNDDNDILTAAIVASVISSGSHEGYKADPDFSGGGGSFGGAGASGEFEPENAAVEPETSALETSDTAGDGTTSE